MQLIHSFVASLGMIRLISERCMMKPMDSRAAAFVHYYAREGYLQHVQSVCNVLIKHASSPVLQFWRAYGLLASGATAEVTQHDQLRQHSM
jgi:hypothetical protein